MLLGVISDTHGQIEITARAVHAFENHGVDEVVHCGDVGGAAIVGLFRPFTTHFVAGNCDSPIRLQMAVEAAGQRFYGHVGDLELAGRRIAFLHGDSHFAFQGLLTQGGWHLIAHGHTHRAEWYQHGDTLILNPGAMTRCQRPSVALIQLPELHVTPIGL